jgi:MSHA biogenesis protein MshP
MKFSQTLLAVAKHSATSPIQRGFALVSAIFLLVILAALGVAMVTFSTAQHTSSSLDVMGSRAYQAARAGVEWYLYQRLNPQVSSNNPTYCVNSSAAGTAATPVSFALPAGTSLSPFTVTVTCTATANAPASVSPAIIVRTITAYACNQPIGGACPGTPARDYVEREVQVTLQENK